jgi:hypothetical protein
MTWRYQAVYEEGPRTEERSYTVIEVFLDKKGLLTAWTAEPKTAAHGCSPDELLRDLAMMISDAIRWQPVARSALKVGLKFKRSHEE